MPDDNSQKLSMIGYGKFCSCVNCHSFDIIIMQVNFYADNIVCMMTIFSGFFDEVVTPVGHV